MKSGEMRGVVYLEGYSPLALICWCACAGLISARVLDSGFPEVWDPVKLESDPLKLIPRLLDQIIALGQTAQQLRPELSDNGHRPEKLSEIAKQLVEGGEDAP